MRCIMIQQDLLLYSVIAAFITFILLLAWVIYLHIRLSRMLRGKDARTLEDTVNEICREVNVLTGARAEIEKYLENVEARLRRNVSGVHTIRFNPFKGTGAGGNQSFATAFLDEYGNGVVISSLYSRERVSVYAKPLVKQKSEFELSSEEKEAIKGAATPKISD